MPFLDSCHQVRWFTTPGELRRIADKMERQWLGSLGGEDLTCHTLLWEPKRGTPIELHIVVDQDVIRDEYPGR